MYVVKSIFTSKMHSNCIFNFIKNRERETEEWKNKKGKPEHSPFILDIPKICLPVLPTTLFGSSHDLGYEHAEWITHHSALITQEANWYKTTQYI
jgi:hypothetical protein